MSACPSDARTASRRIRKPNRCPETPKRKRRPGRPSSYRPEYCDVGIDAGKEGWSLTATAAKIGVHRATLLDWGTAHPEFGDALKVHRAHRAHWWEERGEAWRRARPSHRVHLRSQERRAGRVARHPAPAPRAHGQGQRTRQVRTQRQGAPAPRGSQTAAGTRSSIISTAGRRRNQRRHERRRQWGALALRTGRP